MRTNRASRRLIGIAAAAISIAIAAPAGLAQTGEPVYIPPPSGVLLPPPGSGPAPEGSAARKLQLKKCIAKAQTKFGNNKPKRKKAIKKCKKKYG